TEIERVDVAIGGAGLSGNLQALALARCLGEDVTVAVVDPSPKFGGVPGDPRASTISESSRQLLMTLGLWDDLEEDAQPISEIRLTDSDLEDAVRPTALAYANTVPEAFSDEPVAASHIVANTRLAAVIQSALVSEPGVRRIVAKIDDFQATPGAIELTCGRTAFTAGLLIASDGRNSALRRRAGIKVNRADHGQAAIVAVVRHSEPHGGVAVQHFLPSGPFAILPMTGNRSCVTWTENARVAKRLLEGDPAKLLAALEARFGGQLGNLELEGQQGGFPIVTQVARKFVADRFALIGDAARAVHPIAGQGLNLAIRDIAAMTECITDGLRVGLDVADPATLERYERWRRFDSNVSAAMFAGLNRMFAVSNPLARSARGFGMSLIDRLPGVKQRLVAGAAGQVGDLPKLLRGELV
ncbi:MAG: FAD-dependent monooxygenase, partial [Pseudomonadota bacterium]